MYDTSHKAVRKRTHITKTGSCCVIPNPMCANRGWEQCNTTYVLATRHLYTDPKTQAHALGCTLGGLGVGGGWGGGSACTRHGCTHSAFKWRSCFSLTCTCTEGEAERRGRGGKGESFTHQNYVTAASQKVKDTCDWLPVNGQLVGKVTSHAAAYTANSEGAQRASTAYLLPTCSPACVCRQVGNTCQFSRHVCM